MDPYLNDREKTGEVDHDKEDKWLKYKKREVIPAWEREVLLSYLLLWCPPHIILSSYDFLHWKGFFL